MASGPDPRPHVDGQSYKALLVGIRGSVNERYPELRTPHNDVALVRDLLIDCYGYSAADITSLVDNGSEDQVQPTRANILTAIKDLVKDAKEGDHFFFHYSGQSMQVSNRSNTEEDGMDECLVPADGVDSRIVDNELKAALVLPLPAGSQLVAILDTRHSGSLLDLNHYRCNRVFVPWIRRGRRRSEEFPHEASRWKVRAWRRNSEELHRKLTLSHSPTPSESESESEFPSTSLLPDVQRSESPVGMFSCNGWCRDSEEVAVPVERADVISLACHDPGPWWDGYVGMTSSLVKILRRKPNQSLKELLLSVSHHMHMIPEGLVDSFDSFRNPELSSSRPLDMERSTKSFFGRGHTVGLPPDTRAEVHTADGEDLSALQAACTQGHLDTVRLLLEQGGANEVDEEYGSALQAASMNGHTDIVELLLENGVSVNAGRGEFASALQAAAAQGNIHVVSLLLGHGADVNISGGMFGGALQAASVRDHVDTARFLLDNGANVDAVGGKYGNALKAAHKKGYTDVVRLLLERGANTVQDNFVMLVVKDINKQNITISLPVESCRTWATFRDQLVEQGVQPLQYIQADEFVVRPEGPDTQPISQENWTGWISLFCSASVVQRPGPGVTLCIIRPENQPCCDNPTENTDGSKCERCGMPIINLPVKQQPLLTGGSRGFPPTTVTALAPTPPKPIPPKSSGTTLSGPPATTSDALASASPSTMPPPLQSLPIGPPQFPPTAPPDSAPTEAVTTSFELTPENSVMRRRKRRASEGPSLAPITSPEPDNHRQESTSTVSVQWAKWVAQIGPGIVSRSPGALFARSLAKTAKWFARGVSNCLLTLYLFMIAPPFVIHKDLEWDRLRLENRLTIFQWTMAGNLSLAGLSAALLALTNLQNNPVAQSFVILSGIFSFFGLTYTAFLALHMGDSKEKFFTWVLKQENLIHTSSSLWNLTIVMSLPLTWMAWALLNLCLGGLSYSISRLRSDKIPDLNPVPFNNIQMGVFMLAFVASAMCAFMIHLEIRKYGLSLKPRWHNTCEASLEEEENISY